MNQSLVHTDQRIGIFIDVQNLYHSAKNLYQGRVNYKELIKHLTSDRRLIRAVGYVVKSENDEDVVPAVDKPAQGRSAMGRKSEASFFDALTKAGIELRVKDLQVYPGGLKKADWDVGMAVDAIRMSRFLDVVILVTGDGDFIPLVEYLKWGTGVGVEVTGFDRSTSGRLKEVADTFIPLEKIPRVILKR